VQELGVGLVYWEKLAPIFEAGVELASVLELEPQTLWEKRGTASGLIYHVNDSLLDKVAKLPQVKLAHGVAHPLGGTTVDPIEYLTAWQHTLEVLDPKWVSEHLSFNRSTFGGVVEDVGFLLPPRQTLSGVEQAVNNIEYMRRALGRPLAFETGVNYFKPRTDELSDGEFFGRIAESAQCGILLDLHNLWVNEQNGRQKAREALKRIPLERVWEVHLAGGMKLNSYWLDAHSGSVPEPVMELAAEVIPRLPNLGALIFEILPEHLPRLGIDGVCRQLEALHGLWALRTPKKAIVVQAEYGSISPIPQIVAASSPGDVAQWECAITDLLRNRPVAGIFAELADDPGTDLLRQLVTEFRSASITRTLRYSVIALLLSCGSGEVRRLLDTYCHTYPPDMYHGIEGDRFAHFLSRQDDLLNRVPYFSEILAFEHALIRAAVFGLSSEILWSVDPTEIFDALDAGHMPENPARQASKMLVNT
jgi:uncharacterized protein (UPF0276 family)